MGLWFCDLLDADSLLNVHPLELNGCSNQQLVAYYYATMQIRWSGNQIQSNEQHDRLLRRMDLKGTDLPRSMAKL